MKVCVGFQRSTVGLASAPATSPSPVQLQRMLLGRAPMAFNRRSASIREFVAREAVAAAIGSFMVSKRTAPLPASPRILRLRTRLRRRRASSCPLILRKYEIAAMTMEILLLCANPKWEKLSGGSRRRMGRAAGGLLWSETEAANAGRYSSCSSSPSSSAR